MTGIDETWPVASSPATGHPTHDDDAPTRPGIDEMDIDELVAAIRRPLVYPLPLRDKALEEP